MELLLQPKVESVATEMTPSARKRRSLRERPPRRPQKSKPPRATPVPVPGEKGQAGDFPLATCCGVELANLRFAPLLEAETLAPEQSELEVKTVSVAVTGAVPLTVVVLLEFPMV